MILLSLHSPQAEDCRGNHSDPADDPGGNRAQKRIVNAGGKK